MRQFVWWRDFDYVVAAHVGDPIVRNDVNRWMRRGRYGIVDRDRANWLVTAGL